jgi:hypothetical protein
VNGRFIRIYLGLTLKEKEKSYKCRKREKCFIKVTKVTQKLTFKTISPHTGSI